MERVSQTKSKGEEEEMTERTVIINLDSRVGNMLYQFLQMLEMEYPIDIKIIDEEMPK